MTDLNWGNKGDYTTQFNNQSVIGSYDFTPETARSVYIRGYGITSATDQKPVLGTSAMGPCLGVAIYNSEKKTAAIAHLDTRTDLSSFKKLLEQMSNGGQKLEISLAGGLKGDPNSEKMVAEAHSIIAQQSNAEIVHSEILNPAGTLKSLAIDSRNGKIYTQFFTGDMDKGNRSEMMALHAQTADQVTPLRPEYINGRDISSLPLTPPAPATSLQSPVRP